MGKLLSYIGQMNGMSKALLGFIAAALSLLPIAALSQSRTDKAGAFDYYVLALSWSPSWCALEGDRRGSEQCDAALDHGFVVHGLWPQYEHGWPSNCTTSERDPSRRQTRDMADIMGSSGSAWHQWKKHGRCSGLSALDYFSHLRAAFASIKRPSVLRQISAPLDIPPSVIEAAFLEVNPGMSPDGVTITCKSGLIMEARICMTRELELRQCGRDVRRDCSARSVIVTPIR